MQPDPWKPPVTYTGQLTKLLKPTKFKLLSVVGLGALSIFWQLRDLCSRVGIEEYPTAPYGPFEGLGTSEPTALTVSEPSQVLTISNPSPVLRDLKVLENLSSNQSALLGLAKQVLKSADELKKRGSRGALWYRPGGPGHWYAFHSYSFEVPEYLRKIFMAEDNHNVFRAFMSCFAPSAAQIPRQVPGYEVVFDGEDIALDSEAHDRAITLFNQKQLKLNTPVSGHVQFGSYSNVVFSHCNRIADQDVILWYGLATTLASHPLDGVVGWGLAYDTRNHQMVSFHMGAGENNVPTVDRVNHLVAAFVFLTMFHTFAALVRTARTPEVPSLLGPDRDERLDLAARHYPEVENWRTAGRLLDTTAIFASLLRQGVFGTNVVGRSSVQIEEIDENLS